jgi:uncharacterized protein (TIRG00374 family)
LELEVNKEDKDVLESIKIQRIILPILLGLGVVGYLMYRQLNWEEFKGISWNLWTLFWLLMAGGSYLLRHFFYSWRLKIMSSDEFSWWKSFELITIWEFASSVSPTSIGGSAVALFLLAQEKISTAKTVSIVLYSIVLDTLYFVVSMIILFLLAGPVIIRPGMINLGEIDGYGLTFFIVVVVMLLYGALFAYGLFVRPDHLKRILLAISRIKILKRFKEDIAQTAEDVVVTSQELSGQPVAFHFKAIMATTMAWTLRFLALNFIIIALVGSTPMDFWNQFIIFARGETMYAVTAFSPTPGGSGIAEYLFGGFFSDYIPTGIATVIALIWRLITYYPYLVLGAIVIPVWIREVIIRRKKMKLAE